MFWRPYVKAGCKVNESLEMCSHFSFYLPVNGVEGWLVLSNGPSI